MAVIDQVEFNTNNDEISSEPILKLENVRKIYNPNTANKTVAIKDLNLTINQGEFISIIGPSGSGKSTLLQIAGCMDNLTSGKLMLKDFEINKVKEKNLAKIRKSYIGFVFQSYYLIDSETVLGNILAPLIPYKIKESDRKFALELLEKVGLKSKIDKQINQLSGGEQQRVAICRALINKPAILFADEPTGNLDTKTGTKIIELLEKLNKELKITLILVTHNNSLADRAKRQIKLLDGHIIRDSFN